MNIIVKATINDNRFIRIDASYKVLQLIDKEFTYPDFSKCWVYSSFKKERIEWVHFLVTHKNTPTTALLPIGFQQQLKQWLDDNGARYKFFDKRELQEFTYSRDDIKKSIDYLELRDYQIDAIEICLQKRSGIVKAPTGSGKSELFISLCKLMKQPTLILFSKIDLAHQTMKRMKKAGVDAGIVQGGNIDEDHQVVMATVQSGHKLQRTDYTMVVVDETHRAKSEQYQELLRMKNFIYRFGFSATPWVKDKLSNARVESFIGNEIYEVNPKKLIEDKHIAKPMIHIYPVTRPGGLENYKWEGAERNGIIRNTYRNTLIAKITRDLVGQVLILVKKIEQGKELEQLIPGSLFIYGETPAKEREEVTQKFDAGEDFILIASTIFDEGIDIKNVNTVIIAGGGSSFVKALQRVGRGTRITKNKKHVQIIDFLDDINPILFKHSRERIKIYKTYGYEDILEHDDMEVKRMMLQK